MKENSIEEIQSVDNLIKDIERCGYIDAKIGKEDDFQIESILFYLKDYKRVLKENEELKVSDSSNSKIIANMSTRHFQDREKIRNSIPVQKIKDNLLKYQQEYELLFEHQSGKESNRTKYLRGRIHMCQELIEGRE